MNIMQLMPVRKILPTAIILAAFACSPFAFAQEAADTNKKYGLGLEITPQLGYRFGGTFENSDADEDYDLADNPSLGLVVNWPATDYTQWEVYYSRQDTSVDISGFVVTDEKVDIDVEYLQIGGTYLFEQTNQYSQPFFLATVGVAKLSPDAPGTRSDSFFSFSIGGGWKFFPNERFGLRLEGRLLGTFLSSDSDIFCKSGPDGADCIVEIRGDALYQFETNAGFIVRF